MNKTSQFVITISRQLGSGGAYLGQKLAKDLDVFYADREIIHQAAKELSVLEEDVEYRDEKTISFWESFFRSFAYTSNTYIAPVLIGPTDRQVYEAESQIIKRIAKERSAVIIGRCSTHILSSHPNHLSIFLHADIAFRKNRVQNLYRLSEEDAEKMIVESDKDRELYYHTFTGKQWLDVRQYGLTIDTGKIGLEKSETLIMESIA